MKLNYCYNCLHCTVTENGRLQCTKKHWKRTYSQKYIQYDISPKLLKIFMNCTDYKRTENETTEY